MPYAAWHTQTDVLVDVLVEQSTVRLTTEARRGASLDNAQTSFTSTRVQYVVNRPVTSRSCYRQTKV